MEKNNNIYGVLDRDNIHHDISHNLKKTKKYATNNGYSIISIRYDCGYYVEPVLYLSDNKWVCYQTNGIDT